jgi:hypothetical protein
MRFRPRAARRCSMFGAARRPPRRPPHRPREDPRLVINPDAPWYAHFNLLDRISALTA